MTPLRLINPRVPRCTAADVLDQILADTSPRVRRARRRSAWRARWRWAKYHRRWVTVPTILVVFAFFFWRSHGLTGLVSVISATTTAVLITGLLYAIERADGPPRPGPTGGGWLQ